MADKDLISRTAAIEAVYYNPNRTAIEMIKEVPAVDAIPVEWLRGKMLNSPKELSISAWRVLNEWHPRTEAQK